MWIRIAVLVFFAGLAMGQPDQSIQKWERIGVKKVGHKLETDSFKVGKEKTYRFIKIRVFDAGLIIQGWVFEYRNGNVQHVGFVGFAPENKQYPPVPVQGRLKKIHFRYQSAEVKKKARVEVLGLK